MAPEQLADASAVTPAADVYSLGAVLFEIVSGLPPSGGPAAVRARREAALQARGRAGASGPIAPLEAVIAACLARNPADRPPAADLSRCLAGIAASLDDGKASGIFDEDEEIAGVGAARGARP